jgi:hypothetical protein
LVATLVRRGCSAQLVKHLVCRPHTHPACLLQGIYLLLERLKFPVYRRLFRRVQLLHAEANPAKAAQLPLGAYTSRLERSSM